ncbi:MAG: zinc ribbon-containing protein [Pseudomonadota bacterium]
MTDAPAQRLVEAYHRMMERVHARLEGMEIGLGPQLSETVESAREKAVELGELSREEAEEIGGYLKRDIEDMAMFMIESGEALRDWMDTDLAVFERELLERMLGVADRTTLELQQLRLQAREAPFYHAHEIAGPGTLQCDACGQTVHMKATGHVPPCPRCGNNRFRRIPSAQM